MLFRSAYINNAIDAIFDKTGDAYYPREAEIYDTASGSVYEGNFTNASAGKSFHFGSDVEDPSVGIGDEITYNINVAWTSNNAKFKVRYSDDVAGNEIEVYLDDVLKGTFTTEDTGTWSDFAWDTEQIDLGIITSGTHTIKLRVFTGGSFGVHLDAFVLYDFSNETTQYLVCEIYIATLGRAPAYAGLTYWTNAVESGEFTIEQVAQSFFDQPETKQKFPEGSSNSEFITNIFDNVLNRVPADGGLTYWVDALNSGKIRRDQAIMAIINGAKSATGSSDDAAMLAKKTEIGLLFAYSDVGSMTDEIGRASCRERV